MLKTLSLPLMAGAAVLLSGCGLVYKPTGHVLAAYSQDEVVPHVMASDDLDLSACGTGMGQNQLLSPFSRMIDRPARVLLTTNLLAGPCSEAQAQEADLRFERALRGGDTVAARNARTQAQRMYRRTALRRYQTYKDSVRDFGELGDDECPSLSGETDEIEHLVGS